ncbi:hypothetical protein MKX47_21125 [Solibacillus sp. FSL R7-0668]|uniref:hypothetical protein n=1 Tax=Solibacillus sp. FSL R7-0668 TaxID=2921688 RepID=UPI0030F68BA5
MMKEIMKRAWTLAKQGVKKFGGKVREYLASSLSIAWEESKAMVNTIVKSWTTSKGAQVEMTYSTSRAVQTRNAMDDLVETIENGLKIESVVLNGESVNTWNTNRKYKEHKLSMGVVEFKGKKCKIEIEMPEAISLEVFGPLEKTVVPAKKEETLRCKHCGEFCYGDCQANK